jgi:hypothetical protein
MPARGPDENMEGRETMATSNTVDRDFEDALDRDILDFIEGGVLQTGTEDRFNELSLRLFRFQFEKNLPFQKYCRKRGVLPDGIASWEEIPAVPTTAFKVIPLATFPVERAAKVFKTSGTTDQARPGTVYLDEAGLRIFQASCRRIIEEYFFPEGDKVHGLLLAPSPEIAPTMHLAYAIATCMEGHTLEASRFLVKADGLDLEALVGGLKRSEAAGEPVSLAGATYGFVRFLDGCRAKGLRFRLPAGTRLIHGGGYKGRSREMSKPDFLALVTEVLGIPREFIVDCLGLSEVSALFPENVYRNHVRCIDEPVFKPHSPWTRTMAVHPETLERLPKGEAGLLRHCCLANRSTVFAVQTDDFGTEVDGGFEFAGRAKASESRGCSIAVDEMVQDL